MITELLRVLNYFKVNMSYDSMLDCSLYELDYWIARANKLVEEEEERQREKELYLQDGDYSYIKE